MKTLGLWLYGIGLLWIVSLSILLIVASPVLFVYKILTQKRKAS